MNKGLKLFSFPPAFAGCCCWNYPLMNKGLKHLIDPPEKGKTEYLLELPPDE